MADGVGALKRHHLGGGEALFVERGEEHRHFLVWCHEVARDLRLVRHGAVAAARRDGPALAARQHHGVARRKLEHIGARYHARAGRLHGGLGGVDGVEVAQPGVDGGVLLHKSRPVQQQRSVAAAHEAVVVR